MSIRTPQIGAIQLYNPRGPLSLCVKHRRNLHTQIAPDLSELLSSPFSSRILLAIVLAAPISTSNSPKRRSLSNSSMMMGIKSDVQKQSGLKTTRKK